MKIPFIKFMIDFFKIPRSYLSYYTQKWYNIDCGLVKLKGRIAMYKWTYQTEFGAITIGANMNSITYLKTYDTYEGEFKETDLIQRAFLQLREYFSGERCYFDVPLNPKGTEFQNQVWIALNDIPYGKTITYAQLARMMDKPKAIRAAGAANGKNPIYIMIPCHRVIGSNGSLTGYDGGLDMKKKLLRLEGVEF